MMAGRMASQLPLDLRLRDAAQFSTFHSGTHGWLVALLRGMVRRSDPGSERQVFLHGPDGGGKTHLLQAFCHEASVHGRACAYLPLGELGERDPAAVFDDLERLDLLALDDLQAVSSDPDWARALFGLINRLREYDRPLLMAARSAPDGLDCGLPDLVSRLSWGPVFRLDQPGDLQLKAILRLRAGLRGLELGDAVAEYLIRHECRDLEFLLALLDRLDLAALAEQRRLTIPFIRSQLRAQVGGD